MSISPSYHETVIIGHLQEMKLLILMLCVSALQLQDTLKGFRFKDNKSKYKWEDGKNGMVQLNYDSFLPPSMTVCLRGRILYKRHGDWNEWFNVFITNNKPRIGTLPCDFGLSQRSNGELTVQSQTILPPLYALMNKEEQDKAKEAKSWPSRNSLRKWTHACVIGDFKNEKLTLVLNGKKINETEFKFSKSLPKDYFSEELRLSGQILPGFAVEFGRSVYDSNPIIGELLDINVWDHSLNEEAMEAITNCKKIEMKVGNLINMTSPFNVTGPLCQPIELAKEELSCQYTNKDLLLPARANTFSAALKQCDRLLKNSFGPLFKTPENYALLYKRIQNLPKTEGFKDFCWFGGSVLVWLPYKKASGKTTWNHIIDGSELVWDTTLYAVEKPSTEVEAKDVCLRWYTGPLAAKLRHAHWHDCYEKHTLDWSPCVTCSVPHTLGKLSKITRYPPPHKSDKRQ